MLLPASSWAQTTSPSPSGHDQETVAQLVEQIKQLQQQDHDLLERIKILEATQPQAAPVTEADAPPTAPPQPAEQSPPPPPPVAAPHDWHDVHGIQFRGFGELDYKVLNQRQPELGTYGFVPGSAGNFYTGDFGLFVTSRLTARDQRAF